MFISLVEAIYQGCGVWEQGPRDAVEISGKDAGKFLNGMLTNDVFSLESGMGQLTGTVDDRGRLTGRMELYCLEAERYLAVLEGVQSSLFIELLDRYLFMEDVSLVSLKEQYHWFTVQGGGASRLLTQANLLSSPCDVNALEGGGWVLKRDRIGWGGFDFCVPTACTKEIRTALSKVCAIMGEQDDLKGLRVLWGEPTWPADMSEKQFIHELGLRDKMLNFNKGCYLGQESIQRLDAMGKIRKRLCGIRLDTQWIPDVGSDVLVDDGTCVGRFTSGVRFDEQTVMGLAIVRIPHDQSGTKIRVSSAGKECDGQVEELPFPEWHACLETR